MKTIKEWYLEIPNEDTRKRALFNLSKTKNADEMQEDLDGALYCGFDWSKSEEGSKYWVGVCNRLFLDPIVDESTYTPSDEEYDNFMKAILYDTDKELLVEFIEWYAVHYGYLINKDNVDVFLKEKK